jgi:hypothetical protein
MRINKRYIVDKRGKPKEVIILLKDFRKIEELLGLDLNSGTIRELREARTDRETRNKAAYVDLDSIS